MVEVVILETLDVALLRALDLVGHPWGWRLRQSYGQEVVARRGAGRIALAEGSPGHYLKQMLVGAWLLVTGLAAVVGISTSRGVLSGIVTASAVAVPATAAVVHGVVDGLRRRPKVPDDWASSHTRSNVWLLVAYVVCLGVCLLLYLP